MLSDYFLGLAQLKAVINKLPENDYHVFRYQCIKVFNKHYIEFADLIYLLSFFLHSGYKSK